MTICVEIDVFAVFFFANSKGEFAQIEKIQIP